jgi:hypothetical protein
MVNIAEDQDFRVRAAVYDGTISAGAPPSADDLANRLGLTRENVQESLERLAAAKALVLQRESREILMANPFSAVPTPFAVYANDRLYYGNCIWDALGIAAMLHADARVVSSCGCCSEAMQLSVKGASLLPIEAVIHFAIPASRWWNDIVYN